MRPKGVRKENPLPLRNNYYYAIDWGAEGQPCLVDWKGTPEEGALGGQAAQVLADIEDHCNYIWYHNPSPSYLCLDDRVFREQNGQIGEVLTATTTTTNWPTEIGYRNGSDSDITSFSPGNIYWLRGSSLTYERGALLRLTATGLVVAASGESAQFEAAASYQSGEWVAARYLGSVKPTPVLINLGPTSYEFDGWQFETVQWIPQVHYPFKYNKSLDFYNRYSQLESFFIIEEDIIERHDYKFKFVRLLHFTDRDGPCHACRLLMERVPIAVGEVLL